MAHEGDGERFEFAVTVIRSDVEWRVEVADAAGELGVTESFDPRTAMRAASEVLAEAVAPSGGDRVSRFYGKLRPVS